MIASAILHNLLAVLAGLSTGHSRARPDIQMSSQIVRQFTAFDPIHRSSMSRLTVGQLAGSPQLQSHTSSAALKSP